jgi:signal transduction histidine kinase
MFIVVLNTQHFVKNDFLVFLGISYLIISIIDFMHVFTVKGIPFFNITDGEITIHFWVYARLLEATSLLIAAYFIKNKLNVKLMISLMILILIFITWASFVLQKPTMFNSNGLSNAKVYSEYFVITLLSISIIIYWKTRSLLAPKVLFFLLSSLVLTIIAELCFTLYTSFTGLAFVIGHIVKFLSFWMLYQGVIQTTLSDPLRVLTINSNSYYAIPHPAICINQAGIISQVNQAAQRSINLNIEQLIHQPIHDFFHPDSSLPDECPFCQAIEQGQELSNKVVFFPQNNRWFLLSVTALEKGNLASGMVQSLTDINYQKQQELELVNYKQQLELRVQQRTAELEQSVEALNQRQVQLIEAEKMASLGSLVAGVAHEINTPVGICITATSHLSEIGQEIKHKFEGNQISRKYLAEYINESIECSQLMLSNLNRAAELIRSFKQVAVDQSNSLSRVYYIKNYINEVLISLKFKIKNSQITLNFDTENDFEVQGEPSAMSQILTNLFINSLAHAFEHEAKGDISISVSLEEEQVVLTYHDSGCGISTEHIKHIFEPFYTTKRGQGGCGLGLHIVYNLVSQSLHGNIACQSEPDNGTNFIIKFPPHYGESTTQQQ